MNLRLQYVLLLAIRINAESKNDYCHVRCRSFRNKTEKKNVFFLKGEKLIFINQTEGNGIYNKIAFSLFFFLHCFTWKLMLSKKARSILFQSYVSFERKTLLHLTHISESIINNMWMKTRMFYSTKECFILDLKKRKNFLLWIIKIKRKLISALEGIENHFIESALVEKGILQTK